MVSHHLGVLTLVIVPLLAFFSLTNGETFYVRPILPNLSCPTHPCHTLSEHAHDPGQYLKNWNLTLQFLPGYHTLNVNMTITSVYRLEILGNSSTVMPTRVLCSLRVGFVFRDIPNVRIDGVTFVSCARPHVAQAENSHFKTYYGLYLQSVQTAEIIDCTFQDSYGSALGVVDSHVVMRGNNSFLNNCRLCSNRRCHWNPKCYGASIFAHTSNLTIIGSNIFIGNSAESGAGLHAETSSSVNISGDTKFIGNSGTDGGGVYVGYNSIITIGGTTKFVNNSAGLSGGGICAEFNSIITVSGSIAIIDNSADTYGGGVEARFNSNVTISGNTTFVGNSAGSKGGGVHAVTNSSLDISGNITFIGNSALVYGGGIHTESYTILNINGNAKFINNSANYCGGGVYTCCNSNVDISGNTYIHNSVSRRGGGVYVEYHSNMNINGKITFSGNSASDCGGGLYASSNSNVNISGNATFIDNLARKHGGGVCATYDSNMIISGNTTESDSTGIHVVFNSNANISGNTTFICNSARNGGGVYVDSNSSVNISGNTNFIGNSATFNGGGIFTGYTSSVNISGNSTFIDNSAERGGGGITVEPNNILSICGNTTFIGNSAGNGGGINVGSDSNVMISGNAAFSRNSAFHGGGVFLESPLILEGNSSFTNCSAVVGGAVYAKNIQLRFSTTTILSANRAQYFGGGLYTYKSSLILPGDNTLTANWAGSRGGGIYAQETKVSFSGTALLNGNVAQLDGGGIYADDSNLNFKGDITIRSNTAQLGGGVYSDNNTIDIDNHNVVFEWNVATYYGGGIYTQRSFLTLAGNSIFIANSAGEGGGIYATANSILNLNGMNTFMANTAHVSGGGIWLDNSNLALNGFNHFVKCVASYEGGAIFTYAATASLTDNNTFDSNSATTGGGIHARWSKVSVTKSCSFKHNTAVFGGGIYTDNSTFQFNGSSTFRGNQANYTGGGIYVARSVLNFLGVSSMAANRAARDGGGIYTRDDCIVNLLGLSNYRNNSAEDTGGGISAFRSIFNLAGQNTFNSNHAVEGGGFYAIKSTVNLPGVNTFVNNSANIYGGGLTAVHSTLHLCGSTTFMSNLGACGGGMYIGDSTVDTDGSNCFMNNMAKSEGGGIDARNSVVEFNGKDVFIANSARNKGAAIHIFFTTLIFQDSSSFVSNSAEYGGGIYSENSNLTFMQHRSSHHAIVSPPCKLFNNASTFHKDNFLNNSAFHGGALYFDLFSIFSLYQTAIVHFQDNHATEFGGAIYAVDVPGPQQFLSQQQIPFRRECFFHILGKEQSPDLTTPLVFVNNTAGIRGSILYGGLLVKCKFRYTSAMELFRMSVLHLGREDDVGHSISSDPTQLCFCKMSELSCGEVSQSRSIYPGQQAEVSVVAIDQSGSTISTLIHTNICSGQNSTCTVSETISYETGENCTSRNYSVTPKKLFNQLELYPSNRSGDTIHLIVNITFESCPIGFEQSNFTGECICDHRIWQYTNSCDIDRHAILRNATRTFWISASYNNGTLEGFIHHCFCPLDYCSTERKYINLSSPDKQCNYNRSGLLCGKCKEGLSLVLGSFQCKKCSNNYLALLIPFALAGVLLVILLFLLHLTVAAGTLHGLIFYANIVEANHHNFFPQSSNNPASIFIAWLNLDLGIETCFCSGMDAYAKLWLDFLFPVYICVIVGFLVYISHHSIKMTKLLGSSPVPVLATLFLLSYAKVLRTIISALSLTILHYPYEDEVVWIHDANVLLAKYIPLALVALLFLLFLFLPYTLLLLLGQWLQTKSHLRTLSWVKNPKLKAILDTYHAPYKPKHRFWTGLLLSLRCALFLVFAFNISGNDSINLLVISSASFGIVVGFALLGSVYKSWYLNALELSFILNLGILAVATHYVLQSGGSQAAVLYTSVGIAFLTFVGLLIYHIYVRIKSNMQYIQYGNQLQHGTEFHHLNNNNDNSGNLCDQPRPRGTPPTQVNFHELRSPLDLLSYQ